MPRPNYKDESSDSELDQTFNSVRSDLSIPTTPVSPSNPRFYYQTSPPPTNQVLQDAANNLRVVEAIQAVKPNWAPLEGEDEEVVDEGLVVGEAKGADNMANDPVVPFDEQNEADDPGALREACRSLEKLEWDDTDIGFFFNRMETRMGIAGVKKQFTKFQVCSEVLPKRVQDEVKSILTLSEVEFPNNDAYKMLKTEVYRIFGPRPEHAFERALNRVMVGKPSQLARKLVEDVCRKKLKDCPCCPSNVSALWKRHLSSAVRAGIAHMEFSQANFNAIIELADKIHDNTTTAPAVAAVRTSAPQPSLDETQPAIPYANPEVAAIRGSNRGGRGRGRGGRNNRGGRGGQSGGQAQGQAPRHKGPKHPDLPAGDWKGCQMHFKWGKSVFFCTEPSTCPWKDITAPKPSK